MCVMLACAGWRPDAPACSRLALRVVLLCRAVVVVPSALPVACCAPPTRSSLAPSPRQVVEVVLGLISTSLDAWRTRQVGQEGVGVGG